MDSLLGDVRTRPSVELGLLASAAGLAMGLAPTLVSESVTWALGPVPTPDADTEEGASALLRCTVQDSSPDPVGRAFSSLAVELALASYPGFTMTAPPGNGTPFGVYRAEYVDRSAVTQRVTHADGRREVVA